MSKKKNATPKPVAPKEILEPVDYSELTQEEAIELLAEKDIEIAKLNELVELLSDNDASELSDEDKKIVLDKKLAAIYKVAVKVGDEWMCSVTDCIRGIPFAEMTEEQLHELVEIGTITPIELD